MFGVLTLTFRIDFVLLLIGTKEIQFYSEEIVPDLKIAYYRFPNPTIFPA